MRISEAITLVGRGPLFEGESVQEGELSKDQLKLVQSIARATGWRRGGIWKSIHGLVVDFKAKKSMGAAAYGTAHVTGDLLRALAPVMSKIRFVDVNKTSVSVGV